MKFVPREIYRAPLALLILALLTALLYGHTLNAPWYMDDQRSILLNPAVADLTIAMGQILSPRGVAYFTFALNHWLSGSSPAGFHLVNIAIHLGSGCLVYLLLLRAFRDTPFWPLAGAALFIAHPLQTQAVTYVVQRMTCMSALFFLLALWSFVRSRELVTSGSPFYSPRHLGFYCGALASGILAVVTKENTVVLPLALILFVRTFLPETRWQPLLLAVAPFFLAPLALAGKILLIPLLQGQSAITISPTYALANLSGNSPLHYLLTELSVYWIYLKLFFVPLGQAFEHSYPLAVDLTPKTVVAGGGLLVLAWLGWHLRCMRPRLTFGITWFFLALMVESSVIPLDPLFEHRLYLPLFGLVVASLDLLTLIPRRHVAQGLLLLAVIICSFLAWQRNSLWNDPIALYRDSLKHAPANERTLTNLSTAYISSGKYNEAEQLARQALQINPRYPYALRNLARIHLERNETTQALRYLDEVAQYPELTMTHEYYFFLARARMQQGRSDQAAEFLLRALTFHKEALTYNNLGTAYVNLGRMQDAEASYRNAIAINPDELLPHANLARILHRQGRLQEALNEFTLALKLAPQRSDLHNEAEQVKRALAIPD